ncbi:MAG TPA: YceD family protein [Wenzhouxiangella sp.]|nr:YceD family protein [Wenzhouxiangella sp.]
MNPDKAASAGREYSGSMPLARMSRLEGMIADPGSAEIEFEIDFDRDDHHQIKAVVAVSGQVPLRCQRTLEVYQQAIDSRSTVGIVANDREAEALPDDYEPFLSTDGRVELVRLVGEEVLLGLPLVPIDPDSSRLPGADKKADTHRPFADLAERLKKQTGGGQN